MKSDIELKRDVENELRWDPSVNEENIGVSVVSGVVTLTGHVPSFAERYAAETVVRRIYAVKGLSNELDVHLPGSLGHTDEDIAVSCTKSLDANYSVPRNKVKVVVRDGWVTLEGELDWNFQKEAAMDSVRGLMGVHGVSDNITIKKQASTIDVRAKIIEAFHRSADIDARRIQVETTNGTVVLSGSVRSWAERDTAQQAAWTAPGVTAVDNRVAIVP